MLAQETNALGAGMWKEVSDVSRSSNGWKGNSLYPPARRNDTATSKQDTGIVKGSTEQDLSSLGTEMTFAILVEGTAYEKRGEDPLSGNGVVPVYQPLAKRTRYAGERDGQTKARKLVARIRKERCDRYVNRIVPGGRDAAAKYYST